MSSAAIYGNPDSLPIYENSKNNPVSPYGFHKTMAEMVCQEYSKFWDIKTCCLRIFSAFGPGLRKQLFWDMYHKFKEQDVIRLWGTGKESRDFIYIDDIIQAIDLSIKNSSFDAQVVNVANGKQLTIKEVSDAFVFVLKTDKKVCFNGEERKGDPINWEADIKTLKSWGYKQTVDLEEGIKKYVVWVQQDKK